MHMYMKYLMNILSKLTFELLRRNMRANYPEFDAGELRARQISVLTG